MAASVPRNFKLLDELEDAERSQEGMADISLGETHHRCRVSRHTLVGTSTPPGAGLVTLEDTLMTNWQSTIVAAPGGGQDVRLWFLTLVAGPDYPKEPPTIKFTSKINMACVGSKGDVDPAKVPYLKDWDTSCTLKGALTAVKAAITSASRSQPEDGETF